jgi:pyruvate,water dikinase
MLLYLRRFRRQLPDIVSSFRVDVEALDTLALDTLADKEIVSQIHTLVFHGASRLLNRDFLLIALAGTFNQLVLRILKRTYGEEAPEIFNGLITGVTGNVIMETNKLLWDLAQDALATPEVKEALQLQDPEEAKHTLEQTAAGLRFLDQMQSLLDICGHREMHLDILYPTWGEDPVPVLAYIRGYLEADPQQNPAVRQAALVEDREVLTAEVLAQLRSSWLGRLVHAPMFRWLLTQIHHLLRERDTMHFEWTRLFPPARKLLLELGRRWSERRLVDTAEDIFYLQLDEMGQVADVPHPLHDLIAERRVELATNLHGPWPDIIQDGQEIFRETAESENRRLHGVAGSPGTVTGRCRIIQGPQEFGRLESGDILVTPLTNPVWTPLFAIAGGLVTDVGGILSHGAIVAREYGIPAVMSVSGATDRLVDGQVITVNGDKGIITIIRQAGK